MQNAYKPPCKLSDFKSFFRQCPEVPPVFPKNLRTSLACSTACEGLLHLTIVQENGQFLFIQFIEDLLTITY